MRRIAWSTRLPTKNEAGVGNVVGTVVVGEVVWEGRLSGKVVREGRLGR
jgi:hypothetical protein